MDVARTLDEVCAAHEYEPKLKTVFVEGPSDKAFIDWYLWTREPNYVAVLPIDTVDIPDEMLLKHGLPRGSNRSRVLALASELAERCPDGTVGMLCLADRDFEDYRPSGTPETYAAFTDCNSLELYAFNSESIRKFGMVALGGLRVGADELMPLMSEVLRQVYAIRLANELLGWGMQWIPFASSKYVWIEGSTITFKRQAFVKAYLLKNVRWSDREVFGAELDDVSMRLSSDSGRTIRGHDVAELLLYVIKKTSCTSKFGDSNTLERALLASVERRALEKAPLFQRIGAMAAG
jgi:hypothetical protein